jgi:DNA-binding transcriptional LysR family regulator
MTQQLCSHVAGHAESLQPGLDRAANVARLVGRGARSRAQFGDGASLSADGCVVNGLSAAGGREDVFSRRVNRDESLQLSCHLSRHRQQVLRGHSPLALRIDEAQRALLPIVVGALHAKDLAEPQTAQQQDAPNGCAQFVLALRERRPKVAQFLIIKDTVARGFELGDTGQQLDRVRRQPERRCLGGSAARVEVDVRAMNERGVQMHTRLFERTTRKVTLTEAGEKLAARASGIVAEFEELLHSVQRDEGNLEGHLRVMAPTTLTMEQLGPVFCAFLIAHKGVTMELALVDRSANPAEGGFDLAISGRLASYEGVVDVPLSPVRPVLCAAPGYLQGRAPAAHPRDLADFSCLVFSATGTNWTFQSSRGALSVEVRPRLIADDNRTLLRAALAGLGIALLPSYIAAESLRSGALEIVLPKFEPQENWFKAYVPKRKMGVARVKALLHPLQTDWATRAEHAPEWY